MENLSNRFRKDLLKALIQDPLLLLDHRSCVSVDLFLEEDDKRVATAILNHFDKYGTVPSRAAVEDALEKSGLDVEDMDSFVDELYEAVKSTKYIREKVVRFSWGEKVRQALEASAELLEAGSYDEVRKTMMSALTSGQKESQQGFYWGEKTLDRFKEYKESKNGFKKNAVSTGLTCLDQQMDGGLGAGELGVIIALPNKGKTAMMVNFAKAAIMHSVNTTYYTCETSARNIARRLDMSITGFDKAQLRLKRKTAYSILEPIIEKAKRSLYIKEFPTKSATVGSIAADLDVLANRDGFHPSLLIVDYAALLRSEKQYDEKRFDIASIVESLRGLGKEKNIPVWTPHQSNRSGANEELLTMQNSAECWELSQIADVMVSLNQTPDEKRMNQMRLHFAKNREDGSGSTHMVDFDPSRSRFSDITDAG